MKAATSSKPTASDVQRTLREIGALFRAAGDPERAANEKAYLKSSLKFHGVTVPFVRKLARELWKERNGFKHDELLALAKALLASEYHDLRSLAIALLELGKDELTKKDLRWLIDVVRETANWAHVDWLATKVIGSIIARDPSLLRELPRWASDDNLWVRRTALLAQHDELRQGRGDFELFGKLAASMLHEKEFFIRKAIGWVLREVSKKRPALVKSFIAQNASKMSGLSLREAQKYLG